MRIRFDFGSVTLDAELLDTPTAKAVAAALPISGSALTWGEEVYFDIPVKVAREKDARAVVTRARSPTGRDGHAIAIGYGRTPISEGNEIAAGEPVQCLGEGDRRREDAGKGQGRDEDQGECDQVDAGAKLCFFASCREDDAILEQHSTDSKRGRKDAQEFRLSSWQWPRVRV